MGWMSRFIVHVARVHTDQIGRHRPAPLCGQPPTGRLSYWLLVEDPAEATCRPCKRIAEEQEAALAAADPANHRLTD